MPGSKPHRLTLQVYEQLFGMNAGFDQVQRALAALKENRWFDRDEMECCRALSAEAQAVINSYLANVIETAESEQAGQLFRRRRALERRDESGK